MLNKAQVIGHLGQDPKITVMDKGRGTIASFSVATTEKYFTAKDGTQIPDRTEWHNVVCFGRIADVAKNYIRKGSKVFVEGKMRTRQYEDRNGVKRSIMEINAELIEMLDSKPTSQQQPLDEHRPPQYGSMQQENKKDDDLPF